MKRIRLGIVDDHRLFREGMEALLNANEAFEVTMTAENGADCMEQLQSNCPDVLFLDLDMPIMDGIETMEQIAAEYKELKVIILSMHQEEELILHIIEKGAHGYLLKNTSYTDISRAINSVVNTGYFYDQFVIKIMREGLRVRKRKPVQLNGVTTFTERELEVLSYICKEKTAAEIAEILFLSQRTIEGYKKNLLEKTNTKNTTGMLIYCLKNDIIQLDAL